MNSKNLVTKQKQKQTSRPPKISSMHTKIWAHN